MDEPLNILVIDDNPDDRALAIRELRREFTQAQFEEITESKGFKKRLDAASPDLVITDYQLRWSDGLAVFKNVKAHWSDCPVVMFTGTGSEEIAVEALKSGIEDYVLKSPRHFTRLPGAARVALRMAAQRRELHEMETRYSLLFNTVPVGLYRAKPSGEIADVNPAFAQMLGYASREALVRTNLADLHVDRAQFESWRVILDRDGLTQGFEAQLRKRDGQICWVDHSARAVMDDLGRQTQFEGSFKDITESKLAEEEREKLILELQDALAQVKTLSGLLPICASCKKIRDDKGYWNQIEVFIETHSDAEFTHSFCPDCVKRLYPEVFEEATS